MLQLLCGQLAIQSVLVNYYLLTKVGYRKKQDRAEALNLQHRFRSLVCGPCGADVFVRFCGVVGARA